MNRNLEPIYMEYNSHKKVMITQSLACFIFYTIIFQERKISLRPSTVAENANPDGIADDRRSTK